MQRALPAGRKAPHSAAGRPPDVGNAGEVSGPAAWHQTCCRPACAIECVMRGRRPRSAVGPRTVGQAEQARSKASPAGRPCPRQSGSGCAAPLRAIRIESAWQSRNRAARSSQCSHPPRPEMPLRQQ
eukprot:6197333-Pleurochrysis_carterae.AAC.1